MVEPFRSLLAFCRMTGWGHKRRFPPRRLRRRDAGAVQDLLSGGPRVAAQLGAVTRPSVLLAALMSARARRRRRGGRNPTEDLRRCGSPRISLRRAVAWNSQRDAPGAGQQRAQSALCRILLGAVASAGGVEPQRDGAAEPNRIAGMVVVGVVGQRVGEHVETLTVQHQPRHHLFELGRRKTNQRYLKFLSQPIWASWSVG
jgi:hypothetical protein